MRRIVLFLSALYLSISAFAIEIAPTTHHYEVNWHWGLINMNAGSASVSYTCDGNNFYGILQGKSIDWENRIYMVNDTLDAVLTPSSAQINNINGVYRKPISGKNVNLNNPENYRSIHGAGDLSASGATMEAVTVTAYMTGLYYYAQAIDFDSMHCGQSIDIPINTPNGTKSLRIKYNGIVMDPSSGYDGPLYDITFEYFLDDGQNSYPVTCQIATATRVPVLFSSYIKIGHVQMTLVE